MLFCRETVMTDRVREAVDAAWAGAAAEISEGWLVSKTDSSGEAVGSLSGPASYADGFLRLRVQWRGRNSEQQLVEPASRRSLRRIDSTIVISSTDALLALDPANPVG